MVIPSSHKFPGLQFGKGQISQIWPYLKLAWPFLKDEKIVHFKACFGQIWAKLKYVFILWKFDLSLAFFHFWGFGLFEFLYLVTLLVFVYERWHKSVKSFIFLQNFSSLLLFNQKKERCVIKLFELIYIMCISLL